MINNIEWIFFDIGSTLIDESKAYEHRIKDAILGSQITYDRFYNTMIRFYKQNKKGDLEAIKLYNLKLPAWHSEDEILYPRTIDCLKLLNQKYKIGIIANQPFGTKSRLKTFGILQYIDLIISSAEEGVAKPDLKIFEMALKRSGCKAENTIMIGDRLDNDIKPAKSIGMKTIWIKQGFSKFYTIKTEKEVPDYIVNDLNELYDLLGK
ncbi:MAG: HAD family hydrolase [Clostridium sp.]